MSSHVVTAPLVIARVDDEGHQVYLYQGDRVPHLAEGEVKRLKEGGFIGSDEVEDAPAGVERPAESGPGSAKDKWLAYASAKGVEVDAEASKEDIVAAVTAAGH